MAKTSSTKRFVYFGQQGIGGGLNVSDNPIIVPPNQMVLADNILIGTTLARRKRGGRAYYHTGAYRGTSNYPASGTPIRRVIEYIRYDGSGNILSDLFLHSGAKVWSIDDRNTVAVNRTGALTIDTAAVPCYQVFEGKLYFTSTKTTDGYNKWDGSAATAVAASSHPTDGVGKYIRQAYGKMFMAGVPTFGFRLYWSVAFDAENWTGSGAGSQDLPYDGDPSGITAIFPVFQGSLYVATRRSLYKLDPISGANGYSVTPVSSGIGCIGQASVVATPNDIIFASDRGVHSLSKVLTTDNTAITFVSRDIQKLWVSLLNPALRDRYMATYDETINCVIFSVPSSGSAQNDTLLTYNIEFGTWTVWPNINARSITTCQINNLQTVLIGQEDGELALLNQDDRDDFGVGYTAQFRTGVIYPGNLFATHNRFISVTCIASSTGTATFSVGWTIDGQKSGSKAVQLIDGTQQLGSTFVLGQSIMGVGQPLPNTTTIEDTGYGIQLEVTITGDSDVEFYGFILEVETDGQVIYK